MRARDDATEAGSRRDRHARCASVARLPAVTYGQLVIRVCALKQEPLPGGTMAAYFLPAGGRDTRARHVAYLPDADWSRRVVLLQRHAPAGRRPSPGPRPPRRGPTSHSTRTPVRRPTPPGTASTAPPASPSRSASRCSTTASEYSTSIKHICQSWDTR